MPSTPSLLLVLLAGLAGPRALAAPQAPAFDDAFFAGLEWRELGPYRGGRSAACTGVPSQPLVYWFGATGGGVWKTTDGGVHWEPVSDGFFGGSIGAVAVSEADPNVVYVGGGEETVRGNVSHGDGIWKSVDAGRSWRWVGLPESRHVARIRIHPRDPDVAWAAVMGHLFGPNEERGVYRTTDGGETWERVLFVNADAGCVDLALDPTNPRVLYAGFWRVRRTPWSLESGGEGSGLWKSTDGGDTWTELTRNPGLPRGTVGICGVTVSPTNPDNVYAIVEASDGGVFRSRDGGETWRRTNSDRDLRQRAWYYTRIYADPADEEALYVLNVRFHRSVDGGRTFTTVPTPHGDNHDLWIAPDDPRRMIEANDGGVNVTFDGGRTWSPQDNQPTAQMYRVSCDDDFPYRVLGGQQDNSAVRLRSRSLRGSSIGQRDWEPTAGGESGYVVATPGEPDVVYGGSYGGDLVRLDHRTGLVRAVDPWPDDPMGAGAGAGRYRFQWNFPILFSPHDPGELLAAANVLFRSRDGGASWAVVSPDLTRADPSKTGPSGGPITKDNTSVEYYGTIFAVAESPLAEGVLWTGSDDGLVHLSRDDGATWTDVTPPGLPEWAQVNSIEAHPFAPGGLYVAATRYKLDDFTPYLFRTTDWGASWTRIDAGIPRDRFTRVVRADPVRPGLLFAGTEQGVYVSFDDGAAWSPLQTNLPIVPVTDLCVHEGDLVAATQGRGFWVLDDLSPLRQLDLAAHPGAVVLFAPRDTPRLAGARRRERPGSAGTNPRPGVLVSYLLPAERDPAAALRLEVLDADGTVLRTFTPRPTPGEPPAKLPEGQVDDPRQLPTEPGLDRFAWDLRYPSAESFPGMVLWNGRLAGPLVVPGTYRVRLVYGERSGETSFRVLPDPRSDATPADLVAQRDFLLDLRDRLTRAHRAIRRLRGVREEVRALLERLGSDGDADVRAYAEELLAELAGVEEALYQTKNESRQDPLNFPIRLTDKLAGVGGVVATGDHAPTAQARAVAAELDAAIDAQLARLERALTERVPELDRRARAAGVPSVRVP